MDDIVVRPPRGSGNPAAHPAQQALATPRRSEVATLPDSTPLEGEVPTREPKPLILPFVQTQPYYRSANSNVRKVGIQVTLTGQRVGGENDSDDDDSDGKTYAVPPSRPTEQEVEVFEGPTPGTSRVDLLVTTAQEQSDAEDNFANFPEELRAAGAEHHTDMYNMQQAINVNRDDAVQGIRWKQSFNIPFKACKEATSFIVVCSAKRSILLYIYVIEDVVEKAKSKKTKKIAILKKRIKRRFEDNLDLDLTCGPGGDCDGWNTSWSGISKRSRWF